MSPSPVRKLSPELLLIIFEFLQSPPKDLVACARCCKGWSLLAQEVLHRHIVVTKWNIKRILPNGSWRVPRMQNTVQSLTFRIGFIEFPLADSLSRVFEVLPDRLREMTNLRSISYVRGVGEPKDLSQAIPLIILRNLPATCTSLEIEDSWMRFFSDGDFHICPLFKAHLPRLKHLRVRWSVLCPEMFEASTKADNLKTCIISAISHYTGDARLCGDKNRRAFQPLIDTIRSRSKSGVLGQPDVLSVVSGNAVDRSLENNHYHSSFVRHDILKDRSLSLPYMFMGSDLEDAWLIRTREEDGGDLVGSKPGIIEVIEGRVWLSSPDGVRLPAPLMRHARLPVQKLVHARSEWCRMSDLKCEIWEREELLGRRVLDVGEGELEEQPSVVELQYDGKREHTANVPSCPSRWMFR